MRSNFCQLPVVLLLLLPLELLVLSYDTTTLLVISATTITTFTRHFILPVPLRLDA